MDMLFNLTLALVSTEPSKRIRTKYEKIQPRQIYSNCVANQHHNPYHIIIHTRDKPIMISFQWQNLLYCWHRLREQSRRLTSNDLKVESRLI